MAMLKNHGRSCCATINQITTITQFKAYLKYSENYKTQCVFHSIQEVKTTW